MTHVFLVHFFTGEYLEMLYPVHQIKYVLVNENEAKSFVDAENTRLKKCIDFERAQLAYFEAVPIGKPLFD